MQRFALAALSLVFCASTALGSVFAPIRAAATQKFLTVKILDELIAADADIAIKPTTGGPRYQPGVFWGGTIYLPFADKPATQWTAVDWASFYNEAFHAWWGNVYVKSDAYKAQRTALFADAALRAKYKLAHPGDPRLAMEEGYSETTASTIMMSYPRIRQDPDTGAWGYEPTPFEKLYYDRGRTVSAVSHSDRPGYTPAAEDTYPDEAEFDRLMVWLFGRVAPPRP
jgi:hypothetical protein